MPRLGEALELFAGAGGLSLGLSLAKWRVVAAVDNDQDCAETHQANFADVDFVCRDARQVDYRKFCGVELVAAGPPCQPFSVAGKLLAKADERDMIPHFISALAIVRPRAFLMENVPGLTIERHAEYFQKSLKDMSALGYDVHYTILDAADYGVPQRRRRLFVVGLPRGTKFRFPNATHGASRPNRHVTVAAALRGVPEDAPNTAIVTYAKRPVLRRSPWAGLLLNGKGRPLNQAGVSLTIPATAGGNRTHILDPGGVLLEYHAHLVKGGKPRRGQVEGVRRITVRESARLQSFPDTFQFIGRRSSQYRQVGNAVPPLLAAVVAREIRRALNRTSA